MQGASKVLVEQKSGDHEAFGKGRKVHMTFGELVQQLEQGNDSLYLTTQEVGTSPGQRLPDCSTLARAKMDLCLSKVFTATYALTQCLCLVQCVATAATSKPSTKAFLVLL